MGHLIGPNVVSWYDFCYTKNMNFVPPPMIRCGPSPMEGENGLILYRDPKLDD